MSLIQNELERIESTLNNLDAINKNRNKVVIDNLKHLIIESRFLSKNIISNHDFFMNNVNEDESIFMKRSELIIELTN